MILHIFASPCEVGTLIAMQKCAKWYLKISKNYDFRVFRGGGRGKWVGVAEHTLPHTPPFEVGTL